jgi:D-alanine-D-alanine ligase
MEEVIQQLGHNFIHIPSPYHLLNCSYEVDLIWNISEGLFSRNREAWGPVLAEMREIPMLGSDAFTLTLTLDKITTKKLARFHGVPTSDWKLIKAGSSYSILNFPFPALVKPRYEGTAKGIGRASIISHLDEADAVIKRLLNIYQQDVFLEPLLPGAEYTCAVLGNPLKVLPVLERGVDNATGLGMHVLEQKGESVEDFSLTHSLSEKEEDEIQNWCQTLCLELDIRHFARFDFKRDMNEEIQFLEVNPLPTFAVDSTFAIYAELEGKNYVDFMAEYLESILEEFLN